MKKLLFVCLGNICRSPAAEAIMQKLVKKKGLTHEIAVDSAGTSGWHKGEKADRRMREHGQLRGLKLLSLSRPLTISDFDEFDQIFCMDHSNYKNVLNLAPGEKEREKVHLICNYTQNFPDQEIPDPYYGGKEGFEYVLDLLEDTCMGVLKHIRNPQRPKT